MFLLVLLFNFAMHCTISTVVVVFEINYLILSYFNLCYQQTHAHMLSSNSACDTL